MSDVCSHKEDGKGGAKPAALSLAHASLVSIDHLQPGRSQDLTLVSRDRDLHTGSYCVGAGARWGCSQDT